MIGAVLRRELATTWASPLPWVTGALLHVVAGVLVVGQLQSRGQAVLQPIVPIAGLLLLLVVPVLACRSLAEDVRSGRADLYASIPVRGRALAVGTWLGAWASAVALLAPLSLVVLLVSLWGDPDPGPVLTGALGLTALAGAVAAVGVFTSTVLSSPAVASTVTTLVLLVTWFAHVGPRTTPGALLARLSLSQRLRAAAGGGIDAGDLTFLAAVAMVGVAAAAVTLDLRRAATPRRRGAIVAVVALAAATAVVAVDGQRWTVDLTADRTLTLTDGTRTVLDAVTVPTTITAFVPRDAPGRVEAAVLLDRYRRHNPLVRHRVLDPREAPGEFQRLRGDVAGALVVQQDDRLEHAPSAVEPDVTAALARLVRGSSPEVCVTTGHGEAALDSRLPDGLASFGDLLVANGHRVRSLDLLATPTVPDTCDAIVVPSPTEDLGPAGRALGAWTQTQGRLLLLADPRSDVDHGDLLGPFGLGLDRGIVIEEDPGAHLPDDPTSPIVARYSSAHPAVRRLAPTFLPGVQGIAVSDDTREGATPSRLADTSPASHLDVEPLTSPGFDPAVDLPGPITVAAAVDRSRVRDTIERTRVVVIGDVDLATNAFLQHAANATLLLQAVDWLTLDEDLVTVSTHLPSDRPLLLTSARLVYARLLTTAMVPLAFLLTGAFVWALRRSR